MYLRYIIITPVYGIILRGRAGKVGSSAKVITAFLVCNAVKTTVAIFTNPSGDVS